MAEDHQGDPSPIGGVVVLDRWERVIFSFGIPEQLPGWSRLGPFGRPVDGLPGGALLAGLDLSQPGDLTWEEHLFPPMEDHGIPVSVSAVPFAQRGDDETGRIVLLRDLRSETDDDGAPLLELALRVASEREAAEGLLEGLDAGPEGPMARRFDAYRKALLQQTGDVPRLIRDAVRGRWETRVSSARTSTLCSSGSSGRGNGSSWRRACACCGSCDPS
jgi:hypothetical protein